MGQPSWHTLYKKSKHQPNPSHKSCIQNKETEIPIIFKCNPFKTDKLSFPLILSTQTTHNQAKNNNWTCRSFQNTQSTHIKTGHTIIFKYSTDSHQNIVAHKHTHARAHTHIFASWITFFLNFVFLLTILVNIYIYRKGENAMLSSPSGD